MVVNDLITILKGRCVTSDLGLNREIQYVFCCDCKKIVQEKAVKRALINAGSEIVTFGYDLNPTDQSLESAEKLIF